MACNGHEALASLARAMGAILLVGPDTQTRPVTSNRELWKRSGIQSTVALCDNRGAGCVIEQFHGSSFGSKPHS